MKNLRVLTFVSSSALVTMSVLLACSSDDTVASVPQADGGGGDTGRTDGGGADSAPDTGTPDTSPDAPFDAGLKVDTFAADLADSICKSVARCCFGNANLDGGAAVDGGQFDRAGCLNRYRNFGLEGSQLDAPGSDAGVNANIEIDQAKGSECIQKALNLSCMMGGAELRAARTACFASVKGKRTAGQTCANASECAPGTFCNYADAGKCEPLRGLNGACGDFTTSDIKADEACSYRGGGDTNRYCDTYDYVNDNVRPPADWKCLAAQPNDGNCNTSVWCATGVCDPNTYTCEGQLTYFPPEACETYVKP